MPSATVATVALLVAGGVLSCPAIAGAQAAAAPNDELTVVVRTELPAPTVHHDLHAVPLSGLAGSKRVGWTRLELSVLTQLDTTFVRGPGGQKSFWVSMIRVTLGYRDADLHVAADYRKGGGKYRAVLNHERAHVRADRALVEEYAEKIRDALLAAPLPTYANPLEVHSSAQGLKQVKAEVSRILDSMLAELKTERREASAALDAGAAGSRWQQRR